MILIADEEIKILITAVDNVSKQLDQIQNNISDMTKETVKQTSSLSNAFDKTQGSLLILGNTAARVDSIFDSYSNMQLRLENANERLANAQDRLADANKKVNKLVKEGKKGSEEYVEALNEVDRATRGLTISENNLQRTQNGVTGTFIQMGLSVVTIVASLPALVSGLAATATALTGVQIAAGPVGWVLAGIAVAVGAVMVAVNHFKNEEKEAKEAAEAYNKSLKDVNDTTAALNDTSSQAARSIKNVFDAMKGDFEVKSTDELENARAIAAKKLDIENISAEDEARLRKERVKFYLETGATLQQANELASQESVRIKLEEELKVLESEQRKYEAQRNLKDKSLDLEKRNQETLVGLYEENVASFKTSSEEIIAYVKDTFAVNYLAEYKKINDALIADNERAKQSFAMFYNAKVPSRKINGQESSVPDFARQNLTLPFTNSGNTTINIGSINTNDVGQVPNMVKDLKKKVK